MLVPWRVFLKGPSWVHLHIIVVHRIHGFCRMIGHISVQKKRGIKYVRKGWQMQFFALQEEVKNN